MPKKILQDVVPPKKRSVRDIPIPKIKEEKNSSDDSVRDNNLSNFSGPIEDIRNAKSSKTKTKFWFVLTGILVSILILISTVFAGVNIEIKPKQEKINFDINLDAVVDNIKTKIEGVPFKTMIIENTGSRTTSNIEEKEIDKKASGEIIIFNDYNSSVQRLIKNTRFETPEGLIYRISKSAILPGRTVENGKTIPGSVTVVVHANLPGEDYNIGLTDFTIPGFAGTDRFSKFYARSKTTMTGGFSGVMKVVSDSETKQLQEDIQIDLINELKSKIYNQIPEGYVLYEDGIFVTFENQPNVDLGDSVQVVEKGVLSAILFDKLELSNHIAENVISDLGEDKVEILNIEDLVFKINMKEILDLNKDFTFDFVINGDADFVWIFDELQIKEGLSGKSKKDTDIILSKYSSVEEANVSFRPFWKNSFPKNINRIKIERILDSNI